MMRQAIAILTRNSSMRIASSLTREPSYLHKRLNYVGWYCGERYDPQVVNREEWASDTTVLSFRTYHNYFCYIDTLVVLLH